MSGIRQAFVTNAISFLRDPQTQEAPIEKRIEFLRAKGLNQDEIDAAFQQVGVVGTMSSAAPVAGETSASTDPKLFSVPNLSVAGPLPHQNYYQQAPTHGYATRMYGPAPGEERRDWRDWFIMAVVSGSVMVGVYSLARKFLFPHLVPPPLTAFQQTQEALEAQFDTIAKQLAELEERSEEHGKLVEQQKQQVDNAVGQVEGALTSLREGEDRAKEELREIREEIANIKELIPKLIQSAQSNATSTLADVQNELKSLKGLLLSRPSQPPTPLSSTPGYQVSPMASVGPPILSGRPGIPAWQLAASRTSSISAPEPPNVDLMPVEPNFGRPETKEGLGESGVFVEPIMAEAK